MTTTRGSPSWWAQYTALCRKHFLLSVRVWKSTAAQLFMGLAVCLLLLGFQYIANAVLSSSVLHPPSITIGPIPRCVPGPHSMRVLAHTRTHISAHDSGHPDGYAFASDSADPQAPGCNTVLYGPSTPAIDDLMRRVAVNNGLDPSSDVLPFPGISTGPGFDLSIVNASMSSPTECVVGGCVLPSAECLPCAWVRDNLTTTEYLLAYPNSTQNAIWFFGAYAGDFSYAILYNLTVTQYPFFADSHTMSVKRALDQAFVEIGLNQSGLAGHFDLDVQSRSYPTPVPRLVGYDVFSANGGQWLFVVPMITFFTILVDLVYEKEYKLRVGMRQMGMRSSAFWASWLTYSVVMSVISTFILEASGYALGFTFFRNSSFAATFFLFTLFAIAMLALAVLLSTFISSARTAQTVGYSFILIGFVFQFILTSAYAGIVDLLYADNIYEWVVGVRYALMLYPAFNFSKMFYDISALAGSTMDQADGKLVQGPGFFWSDMFRPRTRTFQGFTCNLPAPVQSYYFLLIDTAIFLVLAFYLDAVLPGPHGTPSHPLFFLGCRYRPTSAPKLSASDMVDEERTLDAGVAAERAFAAGPASSEPDVVVRVSRMRVVYRKGWNAFLTAIGLESCVERSRGWCSSCRFACKRGTGAGYQELPSIPRREPTLGSLNAGPRAPSSAIGAAPGSVNNAGNNQGSGDVLAVNDVSLTVRRGEIVSLLGHNGAGKTTMISVRSPSPHLRMTLMLLRTFMILWALQVLTGLFQSSSGQAIVHGFDVATQVSDVQKYMGVCPQHDILWPQLTARETLHLFCAIKGIAASEYENEIMRVLKQVRLVSVADRNVEKFSGGMKRRLSVAIAALGSPAVLYLDEATTGMDPVNRRKVWRLIQRLKAEAAVILTTHDMEEANVLSDRVAIMAHGRLVALGTPLRLKAAYGTGYRVNVVLCDASAATLEQLRTEVQLRIPTARLALHDAANASFTVPFDALEQMPALLDWIDEHAYAGRAAASDATYVREYGVSGPSLESVFIAVSAAARFDLAQQTSGAPAVADEADELEAQVSAAPPRGHTETSQPAVPEEPATRTPRTYDYRALFIKNMTLIVRQKGLCLCQLITPLVVLSLLVMLQRIIKAEVGATKIEQVPSLLLPLNMNQYYPVISHETPPYPPAAWTQAGAMAVMDTLASRSKDAFLRKLQVPNLETPTMGDVLHAATRGMPPPCHVASAHWRAVGLLRGFVGANEPCIADGAGGVTRRGSAQQQFSDLQRAPSARNPATTDHLSADFGDCLLFFYYTASASSPTTNTTQLEVDVGALPRVYGPHAPPGKLPPPPLNVSTAASGMLKHVSSSWCTLRNGTLVNAPYFDPRLRSSAGDMDSEIMNIANVLNNASTTVLDLQPPCWPASRNVSYDPATERWACPAYIMPDATIDFHALQFPSAGSGVGATLSYTMQVNDLPITGYHRPSNFSRLGLQQIPKWAKALSVTVEPARVALMDMLVRAFAATSNASSWRSDARVDTPATPALAERLPSVIAVGTFPLLQVTNLLQFVEVVGAILHPITLTLQLPLFVYITVLEKEERIVELQRAMGLKYMPYVAVSYLLNFFLYALVCGVFWIAGVGMQFTFFTQTSVGLLATAFIGWGLALCSLAMLVSTFLWSRKAATVIGYVIALFGNLFAIIVAAGIYGYSLPFSLGQAMPLWLYIFPVFGLVRFLYLGTFECIGKMQCYEEFSSAMAVGSEIRATVVSMYLDAIVYFIVALYLDQVLPRKYGVAKSPLFFISSLWSAATTPVQAAATAAYAYLQRWAAMAGMSAAEAADEFAGGEDADVALERDAVANAIERYPSSTALGQTFPILLHHIRKEFEVESSQSWAAGVRGKLRGMWGRSGSQSADSSRERLLPTAAVNHAGDDASASIPLHGVHLEREQLALATQGIKVAVSDMTLSIVPGTCFGLLGENGAGKSTLINMMQGLFPPSSGDGYVNGHHIVKATDMVRLSLGVCPQHDTLWMTLTVAEHLYFYARVKGVPPARVKHNVETALRQVGLLPFANRLAADLSGGMRRRLSIAIALVGDSRVVLVDEPSTGLDAASRRVIWRILDAARQNRVIILVSHDMAEVEALATRIGIMTFGRLRCLGSQQTLKTRYGGGYVLQVNYARGASESDAKAVTRVSSFVSSHFRAAVAESHFTGFMAFRLPVATGSAEQPGTTISRVFQVMSSSAAAVGITDWAVQQVSLDTVFARIVRHYRGASLSVDDEEGSSDGEA